MSIKALVARLVTSAILIGAVGALTAIPAGAANASRVAGGHTAQGQAVKLRVDSRRLRLLRFTGELKCSDGSVLIVQESGFLPTPLGRGGRFADVQVGSTDTVRFRGRAGARAVRGRIRVSDRIAHARCDSRWFRFSARVGG